VVDGLNEVRAQEFCLECTTIANDNYKENAQLIEKLESKFPWPFKALSPSWNICRLTSLRLAESDVELNALKALVENAIAFFYPGESSAGMHAPQMLDSLPTRSWEIILTNMRLSTSLTRYFEVPIPPGRLGHGG
jgi:hypothetical protein